MNSDRRADARPSHAEAILHVFDMDGTILIGTTASRLIAKQTGTSEALDILEARFGQGELTTREFAAAIHPLWAGLEARQVADAFDDAPWIRRIDTVLKDIQARDDHAIVITMSPDFFANMLLSLGFHAIEASRFPPLPLQGRLDRTAILSPEDKPLITELHARGRGIPAERCIAYGDSMSDLHLFQSMKNTVAVNATDELKQLAVASYDGDDLFSAYELGRSLVRSHDR